MRRLAAEHRQTAGCFFPSMSLWNDLADLAFDGVGLTALSAGPMLFHWPKLLQSFLSCTIFPFLLFLCIGWYCGAGVFGAIRCRSLSPSLALTTSFNNNNNDDNIIIIKQVTPIISCKSF